jgi:hypothetical protein
LCVHGIGSAKVVAVLGTVGMADYVSKHTVHECLWLLLAIESGLLLFCTVGAAAYVSKHRSIVFEWLQVVLQHSLHTLSLAYLLLAVAGSSRNLCS